MPSRVSKSSTTNAYDNYNSVSSQSSSAPANNTEDEFDDFDPRGTSASKSSEKYPMLLIPFFLILRKIITYSFKFSRNYRCAHFAVICVQAQCVVWWSRLYINHVGSCTSHL